MKLEYPVANLVKRCETYCVAECCGIDAFHFSPIHTASGLAPLINVPDAEKVSLADLKAQYGSAAASSGEVVIDEMHQYFSPQQLDAFVDEITFNLAVTRELMAQSEARRASRPKYG